MPTYEYHCDACDNHFDEFQGINDPVLKKCPKCKKQKLRRIFGTGAAVIFKGSGFYETDYRSESYKASAKADADNGTGDTKSSGDKKSADTTTAPSTESKPAETKKATKSKSTKSDD
jgi:putative FmdB family regulatory protein